MMRISNKAILLVGGILYGGHAIEGFVSNHQHLHHRSSVIYSTTEEATDAITIDPKDGVKLFGRLAEKYIMLDESGGMCCYSACKDCEFRLPGGGYRMADQSASRPKWIPVYEERVFAGQSKEHTAKWRTAIFDGKLFVTKDEFVESILELDFATPLGGPFVSKSAGTLEDSTGAEYLFDILAEGKEKLTRHKMHLSLTKLSEGEAGLTWPNFSAALGIV
jgi:hypothetical protein